jgi:HD-like signal output (HDOD) protein
MMRIVFVDDDVQVLEGLRRMLFGQREVWRMRFFTEPHEAIASLSEDAAELVISDLQMPGMDGAAFLEQVRKAFPDAIRYVLTGVLDHPLLGRAIRCAHHVIAKPCRPQQLREAIERAETIKSRLGQMNKVSHFSSLNGLPVMPEAHQKVLDMLGSPLASPRRLGQLVSEDVGMSARIVQLANSAYFGRPGRIHDPIQAVLLLGVKTVEAMVLTEGIFARLDPELVRTFGVSAMQAHCFRVSMLARKISADLNFSTEQIEAASTAGILHDAGKIILMSEMKEVFTQALARSRAEGRALYEVEQELVGISHAELIGAMLQLWAMPAEIIEATACHHRPSEAASMLRSEPAATLADVICLADAVDHCFSSSGADGASPEIDSHWLSRLGLVEACRQWTQQHIEIQNKELSNGRKPR